MGEQKKKMGEQKKKLSISIVRKRKRRPHKTSSSVFAVIDDAPSSPPAPARQYIAEFDPSQALTPAVAAPVVIAPLPNSGILCRRKPSPLLAAPSAAATGGLSAFVLDTSTSTSTAAADQSSTSTHYGLTRRDAANNAFDRGTDDEFLDMRVEEFSAGIVAGYGLIVTEGEDTTKVARRAAGQGFGCNPSEPGKDRKRRSGGKRSSRTEDVFQGGRDARHKRPCGGKRSRTDARRPGS